MNAAEGAAAPNNAANPNQPTPFGKYLLLERVAVGGMAELYLAKSFGVAGFEKLIAIKRLLPTMVEDEEFVTMFIDEAKIAGQLNHANIVPLYELGCIGESHFIAMEFVWGKDLLQIINRFRRMRKRMPQAMAAWIASKMCTGLAYAHTQRDRDGKPLQLIHRDVSPANILVNYDGQVKVIDFGIAKAATRNARTDTGVLKGKFGYMSPEQVVGHPIDHRSDLFAVGTCLYEMIACDRLFMRESDLATLEAVSRADAPPLSKVVPEVAPELEAVVLRALAKDPADRFQSANDFQLALQSFLNDQPQPFNGARLAAWMRSAFRVEMFEERQRFDSYAKLNHSPSQEHRPQELAISNHQPMTTASTEATGETLAEEAMSSGDGQLLRDEDELTSVVDRRSVNDPLLSTAAAEPVLADATKVTASPFAGTPAPAKPQRPSGHQRFDARSLDSQTEMPAPPRVSGIAPADSKVAATPRTSGLGAEMSQPAPRELFPPARSAASVPRVAATNVPLQRRATLMQESFAGVHAPPPSDNDDDEDTVQADAHELLEQAEALGLAGAFADNSPDAKDGGDAKSQPGAYKPTPVQGAPYDSNPGVRRQSSASKTNVESGGTGAAVRANPIPQPPRQRPPGVDDNTYRVGRDQVEKYLPNRQRSSRTPSAATAAVALLLLLLLGGALGWLMVARRSRGVVEIRTTPAAAAAVHIDGTPRGRTPLRVEGVSVGEHVVSLTAEGYEAATRKISVPAGTTLLLEVALSAKASVSPAKSPNAEPPNPPEPIGDNSTGKARNAVSKEPPPSVSKEDAPGLAAKATASPNSAASAVTNSGTAEQPEAVAAKTPLPKPSSPTDGAATAAIAAKDATNPPEPGSKDSSASSDPPSKASRKPTRKPVPKAARSAATSTSGAPVATATTGPKKSATANPKAKTLYGNLVVNTMPSSRVYVDGRDTGRTTPILSLKISQGSHRIGLKTPDGTTHEVQIEVQEGQTVKVIKRL